MIAKRTVQTPDPLNQGAEPLSEGLELRYAPGGQLLKFTTGYTKAFKADRTVERPTWAIVSEHEHEFMNVHGQET